MRMIMIASMPTETGNALAKAGKLGPTIQQLLDEMKPEAAYFAEADGKRTAYIFFDMNEPSDLPKVAEPWFLAFNAEVTVRPAMVLEDLAKAGPAIEAAAKKFA